MSELTFDHVVHDETGDVLYLSVGPPAEAAYSEAEDDGNVWRCGADGGVIGLTVTRDHGVLEQWGGMITVRRRDEEYVLELVGDHPNRVVTCHKLAGRTNHQKPVTGR